MQVSTFTPQKITKYEMGFLCTITIPAVYIRAAEFPCSAVKQQGRFISNTGLLISPPFLKQSFKTAQIDVSPVSPFAENYLITAPVIGFLSV